MIRRGRTWSVAALGATAVLAVGLVALPPVRGQGVAKPREVIKTDAEWRKQLTRAQYYVTRQKGTEPAFSGKYVTSHAKGIFHCVCCDAELFSAQHKFNSGTGWPSFYRPIRRTALDTQMDYRNPEPRVEVECARCGAHLGHVFSDGPPPTGMRFCINSVALKLKPFKAKERGNEAQKADPQEQGREPGATAQPSDSRSAATGEAKVAKPKGRARRR